MRVWQKLREQIEVSLRNWLERCQPSTPQILVESMKYSLSAPGKRLRPFLVWLACRAAGGGEDAALPAACAVEMVHTYSLIHDDLPAMDDDDYRRGQLTCHRQFSEALAILAGDALLTMAFQVLSESYPATIAAVSILELARGAGPEGMVGGQVLDLAAEGRSGFGFRPATEADLSLLHQKKTGALIASSLRLGVYVAQAGTNQGVKPEVIKRFDKYASAFGLAFQIADDLLDVEGTQDQTGKRVGKDADRGKLTYPKLIGAEESRRRANILVEEAEAAIQGFGETSVYLAELVRYTVQRNH